MTTLRLIKSIAPIARKRSELFIIVFGLINLALFGQVQAVGPTDTFYGGGAGINITTGTSRFSFWLLRSIQRHHRQLQYGHWRGALEWNTTGARIRLTVFCAQ